MSWSADCSVCADAVESALADVAATCRVLPHAPRLRCFRRGGKWPQLQHYASLLPVARDAARRSSATRCIFGAWAIFSDDDDVWHPERASSYGQSVRQNSASSIVIAPHAFPRAALASTDGVGGIAKTPAQVEILLDDGRARDGSSGAMAKRWRAGGWLATSEHVDFCARLGLVEAFFRRAPPQVLRHPFGDLALCEFLRRLEPVGFVDCTPSCWMYFYNARVSGGPSREQATMLLGISAGGPQDAVWAHRYVGDVLSISPLHHSLRCTARQTSKAVRVLESLLPHVRRQLEVCLLPLAAPNCTQRAELLEFRVGLMLSRAAGLWPTPLCDLVRRRWRELAADVAAELGVPPKCTRAAEFEALE